MRKYKYAVHGTHNGRSTVIETTSVKEAAKTYLKTYPSDRVIHVAKLMWEAPKFKVGRKSPGQSQDEHKAYDEALQELLS